MGDRIESLRTSKQALRFDHFTDAERFCAYYEANFAPTITTYARLADDPELVAALDRDFLGCAIKSNVSEPGRPCSGSTTCCSSPVAAGEDHGFRRHRGTKVDRRSRSVRTLLLCCSTA